MRSLAIQIVLLSMATACTKDTPDPAPSPTSTPTGVADIDGNYYDTLTIGGRTWFTENLRVRRFKNGDSIPYITDNNTWDANHPAPQCCAYQNDPALVPTHGLLYAVSVLQDARGVCPDGWHPSTDDDWKNLETYLGMPQGQLDSVTTPGPLGAWRGVAQNVGGKLKATTSWDGPNLGADNSSGFTALASGQRNNFGLFSGMGEVAAFWSITPGGWVRMLSYQNAGVLRYNHDMGSDQPGYGHSCRCVKD